MAYDAWVNRFGEPDKAAEKIKKDPIGKISSLYPYLGELKNRKVMNLLGSHGSKGVAMALLGAQVSIVDIASENARYAKELSSAAGVNLRYLISDVLELKQEELSSDYDIVIMELGILHYFLDLKQLMDIVYLLLKPGGKFILQDFHPISTKLITSRGKKHKVTGDYFDNSVEEVDVAYMKFVPGIDELTTQEKQGFYKAYHRKWTLGEIITSVANSDLRILRLDEAESPKPDDKGIPKLYTLIASKNI
ncbi:MAG: class I SAM-dependent methyltransferase [Clostridiaceae bacterium]|nr:class I SAM-dependent methyltransferase [Clostridiaceae bacterium]